MSEHLHPVREIRVVEARKALMEAKRILDMPAGKTKTAARLDWALRLDRVLDGLPQTYNAGDLIRYREPDGSWTDGVIVATVTCHENYVVTAGDVRSSTEPGADPDRKLWMICVEKIEPRVKP